MADGRDVDWFDISGVLTEATIERLTAAGLGYLHTTLLRVLVRGIPLRVRLTDTEADIYIGSDEDDTAWLMLRRQDTHTPWAIVVPPTAPGKDDQGDC